MARLKKGRSSKDAPCIVLRANKAPKLPKLNEPRRPKPHRYCFMTGKAMFSYELAEKIAKRLFERGRTPFKLKIYPCPFCSAYHFTKKKQRSHMSRTA